MRHEDKAAKRTDPTEGKGQEPKKNNTWRTRHVNYRQSTDRQKRRTDKHSFREQHTQRMRACNNQMVFSNRMLAERRFHRHHHSPSTSSIGKAASPQSHINAHRLSLSLSVFLPSVRSISWHGPLDRLFSQSPSFSRRRLQYRVQRGYQCNGRSHW